MKAIGLFFTFILGSILSFGQINQLGHPIIRNYTPEEYNGVEQNWAIIQDNRGLMYFANNDKGILEFDGVSWRSIPVERNAIVRSFAKDDKGTIYVGTVGDFGYLAPNKTSGLLEYKSLLSLVLDSTIRSTIQDIYKTYYHKNKVFFCSRQYILVFNGTSIQSINLGDQKKYSSFFTFIVNNHIYIGSYLKGLRELQDNDSIVLAKGGDFYKESDIYSMVPLSSSKILMITPAGFFVYNQDTGESTDFTESNSYLNKLKGSSLPYCGLVLDNNQIGIGTLVAEQPSFLTVDKKGTPSIIANKEIGLQDSWVYYQYQNPNSTLWLAQDLGISKVEIQSAFQKFDERSGLTGIIRDIVRFNNRFYVATTMGVFYLENNTLGYPKFQPVENILETTPETFLIFTDPATKKEKLLLGARPGLFEINNDIAKKINLSNINFTCWSLTQLKSNPSRVYVGITGGLTYIDYKDGNWVNAAYVLKEVIKDEIKYVKEDSKGFIWASTSNNGIIQITDMGSSHELKRFGENEGFPNSSNIEFFNFGDSLIATTNNGLYLFDYNSNTFAPFNPFKGFDSNLGKGIYKIAKTHNGYSIIRYKDVTYSIFESIEKDSLQNQINISTPFKYLPKKWINAIWTDPDGTQWFGIQKELYSYNPKVKRDYKYPYNALIRKVTSKEDTILFNGAFYQINENNRSIISLKQNPEQIYKLPYRFNKLIFEFSATFYEKEEATLFSYFLEGSDDSWSIWNKEAKATYTNLKEGKYTFKVKARNVYGIESTMGEYKFSIAPPWYRTILAWVLYSILFILLVWAIVRWNSRRLIAEKEELEEIVKERTAEVVAQKDEIEAQSEMISIQNEEIKSSIHYASRIQGAILTPNEQIEKIFNEFFILFLPRDIVSGDFYWVTKVGTKKICVVADCTGHGVPGGFMSMLGMSFISQIISKGESFHPGDILNQLRTSVINSLHQTGEIGSSKDGMDIAIYVIDEETNILEFSGANNPLVHIRNNELNHIKSDKMPIGIHMRANEPFTTYTLELLPGDCIYTFSDGYVDQFGGPDARKFMIKNFKDLLLEIHQLPMSDQRERLHKNLLDWHGTSPRIDDVVVMGIRI